MKMNNSFSNGTKVAITPNSLMTYCKCFSFDTYPHVTSILDKISTVPQFRSSLGCGYFESGYPIRDSTPLCLYPIHVDQTSKISLNPCLNQKSILTTWYPIYVAMKSSIAGFVIWRQYWWCLDASIRNVIFRVGIRHESAGTICHRQWRNNY